VCNADGLGYTSAACAGGATYGYSCTGAGTCTDRVCSPGAASLVCASTTARQVCNTDGLAYSATSCSAGQSCNTGTCAVRCGDGIIGASEACDDGNVVNGDGCSSVCVMEGPMSFTYQYVVGFAPTPGYGDDTFSAALGTGQLNDGTAIVTCGTAAAGIAYVGWYVYGSPAGRDGAFIVTPPVGRLVRTVRVAFMPTCPGGITIPTRVDVVDPVTSTLLGTLIPVGTGTTSVWNSITLTTPTSGPIRINITHGGEHTMFTEVELL